MNYCGCKNPQTTDQCKLCFFYCCKLCLQFSRSSHECAGRLWLRPFQHFRPEDKKTPGQTARAPVLLWKKQWRKPYGAGAPKRKPNPAPTYTGSRSISPRIALLLSETSRSTQIFLTSKFRYQPSPSSMSTPTCATAPNA